MPLWFRLVRVRFVNLLVVKTTRNQLKYKEISSEWKEIVRVMNRQKTVTTTAHNAHEQIIQIRQCSKPEPKAKQTYNAFILNIYPSKRRNL